MISIEIDTIAVAVFLRAMIDADTERALAEQALRAGSEILRADASAWIDLETDDGVVLAAIGGEPHGEPSAARTVASADDLVRRVARLDIPEAARLDGPEGDRHRFAVPIRHGDRVTGVAVFELPHDETPSDLDGNSMLMLFSTASIALARLRAHDDLTARLRSTEFELGALRHVVDAHDALVRAFVGGRGLHVALAAAGARLGAELAVTDTHDQQGGAPTDGVPGAEPIVDAPIPGAPGRSLIVVGQGVVDPLTLQRLARVVGLEFARRRERTATETRLTEDLVRTMLEGTDAERAAAWNEASLLGVEVASTPVRVVIAGRSDGGLGLDGLERVERIVARTATGALTTSYEGRAVVFAPVGDERDRARFERLVGELAQAPGSSTLVVGVSTIATSLESSALAVREALFAQRLAERSGEAVAYADRLGFIRLVARSWPSVRVEQIASETLGPLATMPGADGAELRRTLRAYLEHDRRPASAAADLHVHVNTLRYRLKRITDLLDADLDDAEQRFMVLLALKLDDAIARGAAASR